MREPRASPTDCHYHVDFGTPPNFETQRHANFECSHDVLQKIISHMRSGTKSLCLNSPTLKRILSIIIIPVNSKFPTRVYYVWFFFQIQNIGWFRSNVWGILFQEFQHSLISNCPQKISIFFCRNTIDITSCLPKRYQGIFQYIYQTFSNKFKNLPTKKNTFCFPKSAHLDFFFLKKEKALEQLQEARGLRVGLFEGLFSERLFIFYFFLVSWKWGSFLTHLFFWEFRYVLSWVIFGRSSFIQNNSSANWSQFREETMLEGGTMQFFHRQTS